ncbi:MAG: type II secretion system protein [Candidatus Microgenomates bacterium]|jgi:prepilin-type N-terminal cleavage/methylation domain-containing protein
MNKGLIPTFGFTLVELLVSIGILAIIFALTTINLSPIPSNTLETTNLDTLLSDMRSQQSLAMSNDSPYGVHFESTSYTLFQGANYVQGAASNFVVNLDSGISFSNVTFPSSQIVFSAGSGDVVGYTQGQDRFSLISSVTNKSSLEEINQYGATY